MRDLIFVVILTVGIEAFASDGFFLKGERFDGRNVEITWNAETNNIPAALWIYKVVSQNFSAEVISNLLALGSFTENDKTNSVGHGTFRDKSILYFRNKERTKSLGIYPAQGWVTYRDSTAEASAKEPPVNVPDEKQAFEMSVNFLSKLGLTRNDFATKPGSSDLLAYSEYTERGRFDRDQKKYVKEYPLRGVLLTRRIDGVDFFGKGLAGGLRINFGNHGRIINFELVFPNLKPIKKYPIVNQNTLIDWIKNRKAVLPPQQLPESLEIKELNVEKIKLFYLGGIGSEPPEFVYPFALLDVHFNLRGTNIPIKLNCPIVIDP